jgi:hypothetical protein
LTSITNQSREIDYRFHICYPVEYRGLWITAGRNLSPVQIDAETLRLIGLLALDSKNRKRVVETSKMKLLLRIANSGDILSAQTALQAICEIAGDLHEWKKACAAYEIVLKSDGENSHFFLPMSLKIVLLNYFVATFLPYVDPRQSLTWSGPPALMVASEH